MKKFTLIAVAAVLLAAGLSGCGGGGQAENAATVQEGILTVGIVDGQDRFTKTVEGVPGGIEPEIASLTAENMGLELRYDVCQDQDSLFAGINEGKYDLGFGRVANSDARLSDLKVSSTYGKGGLFMVTPKYNYMDSLSLMETGTLGIMEGAEPLLPQIEGADHMVNETYTDLQTLAADIESGILKAGITGEREAVSLISDRLQVQVQELLQSPRESYVAVMPEGSGLDTYVNKAINLRLMDSLGINSDTGE